MADRNYNVLVLCTGNSARSILAEALFNKLGAKRPGRKVTGYSAGSFPKGKPHPLALELLEEVGLPTSDARSKSWDEFAAPNAPPLDFIITVCDNAAGEVCPVWPGHPITAHWGLPDPAAIEETAAARAAFRETLQALERRVRAFLRLPLEELDAGRAQDEMHAIGRME
jgi:arsenate reductase